MHGIHKRRWDGNVAVGGYSVTINMASEKEHSEVTLGEIKTKSVSIQDIAGSGAKEEADIRSVSSEEGDDLYLRDEHYKELALIGRFINVQPCRF